MMNPKVLVRGPNILVGYVWRIQYVENGNLNVQNAVLVVKIHIVFAVLNVGNTTLIV